MTWDNVQKVMIHGSIKTLSDVTVNTTWFPITQWICCNYGYTYHVHWTVRLTSETLRIDDSFRFLTLNDFNF